MKTREYSAILLIVFILISQSLSSCFYGVRGNGKIVKSEREAKNFNSVKISRGLDMILTQDTLEKVVVESDENLQSIIKTEVSNGILKIYSTEPIYNASRSKVHVTVKNIKEADASSGAEISTPSLLKAEVFKVGASSGADVSLNLSCTSLEIENSSGSEVSLTGKTEKLIIDSSSGSDVNSEKMESETCSVTASSGSDVKILVSKKIEAKASSGADITVLGNPVERDIHKSSGGDVTFR